MIKKTQGIILIEKIIGVSEKIKKYAQKSIFNGKGITITQFNILGEMNIGGSISINKLKEKLITSQASLSQLINRMEEGGLIYRELGKRDKREIILVITEKGKKIYNEINERYIKDSIKKLSGLNEKDIENAINLLKVIEKIVDENI